MLKQYLKTVNTSNRIPPALGYVSHVDNHAYYVSYFDTASLAYLGTEMYDDRLQTFNFVTQDFTVVPETPPFTVLTQLTKNKTIPSNISFYPDDEHKFVAHTDDGVTILKCADDEYFDGNQCVYTPVCSKPDTMLPLTEDALNKLVFNKLSARHKTLTHKLKHHPTLFVRCDENLVPRIEECGDGEIFEKDSCVFRPNITSNGQGLVTSAKISELRAKNVKTYISEENCRTHSYGFDDVPSRRSSLTTTIPKTLSMHDAELASKKCFKTSGEVVLGIRPELSKSYATQTKFAFKHNPSKLVDVVIKPIQMIVPVNDNLLHDCSPCSEYGAGHTFIDTSVSNNQFIECLSNNNLFVHTCQNRYYDGSKYMCDVEDVCVEFENGTGNIINSMSNENITFDTGKTVCRDYKVVEVVECDTQNFVSQKKFKHPFNVVLELNLPKQVYGEEGCVSYNFNLIQINNDNYKVRAKNKLDIDFSSFMVGRVSKIKNEEQLQSCDRVSDLVTYSKNLGELALDSKNCMGVECVGDKVVTVDVFDNTQYNLCELGAVVQERIKLNMDEYVDFRNNAVVKHEEYKGECRMEEGDHYFDNVFRIVRDIPCFYTMPMFDIEKDDIV